MPGVVAQQFDDFIVVKSAGSAGAFALTGPGLDQMGIPFGTLEEAIERGRTIAHNSRVSLWDATKNTPAVLVAAYRR